MSNYIPFTYLIKFTNPETKTVLFYYGVRYARNCHPSQLFVSYFTNSKAIKNLIKQFGIDNFCYEVRKEFPNDPIKAHAWEQKVLTRIDAAHRRDFINMSVGGKVLCMIGDDNPSSRPEVKQKISKSVKKYYETNPNPFFGKKHSDETKLKISKKNKGRKLSKETRDKMSAAKKGHAVSIEVRKKMSERMKNNNPSKGKPEVAKHLNIVRKECPHCGIITFIGNLARWHLDKCKEFKCH